MDNTASDLVPGALSYRSTPGATVEGLHIQAPTDTSDP